MGYPMTTAILVGALIANGLLAGVFFAFACSIVPGLRRVDDIAFVTTVRAVNAAILNGWFLTVFLASPVLAGVAVAVAPDEVPVGWLVAAVVCAVITFVVTAAVNVPLNRRLAEAPIDRPAEQTAARQAYERRWNSAHLVRTLSSIAAAVALTIALVQ